MSKKAGQYVRFQVPLVAGLKSLAETLNEIPRLETARAQGGFTPTETSRLEVLHAIENIVRCFSVSAPSMVPGHYTFKVQKPSPKALPERLDEGIRLFNEAAEKAPITLSLACCRDKWNYWSIESGVLPETDLGSYLFDVQRWVVWWGGRERLKRCGFCFRWFVDRGRNKKAVWCSVQCASKWWTRPRRRNRSVKVAVQTFDAEGHIVTRVFGDESNVNGEIIKRGKRGLREDHFGVRRASRGSTRPKSKRSLKVKGS